MRVIAGKFRSRTLKSLDGQETRPTYDRLKETLFNVLSSADKIEDCTWADLFAGTGSVGIEALSRGAKSVHFAESSPAAAKVIRQNLTTLAIANAELAERDAVEALRQWERHGVRFDVCFFDPPYRLHDAYPKVLRALGSLLAPGGIAVAEHEKRFDPGDGVDGLTRYRLLKQGESSLSFYRRAPEASESESSPEA